MRRHIEGRVMRYRSLGDSGLLVSVAGLGCNNFGSRLDVQQTRAVVDAAIDAGTSWTRSRRPLILRPELAFSSCGRPCRRGPGRRPIA